MNNWLCHHFRILFKSTNIVQFQSFLLLDDVKTLVILTEAKGYGL